MDIRLNPTEYAHAAFAGFLRQTSNMIKGRRDAHGQATLGFDIHVMGALGEYAAARALGVFWPGPGSLRGEDAGGVQVRTAGRQHYDLRLHAEDDDDDRFVLVVATDDPLLYRVCGWLPARDGKQDRFWKDPTGKQRWAYFVPQGELRPLEQLRAALHAEQGRVR